MQEAPITALMEPLPALVDLDEMVEDVGLHDPLLAFPLGTEDGETDWSSAFDALIAAKLISPSG